MSCDVAAMDICVLRGGAMCWAWWEVVMASLALL